MGSPLQASRPEHVEAPRLNCIRPCLPVPVCLQLKLPFSREPDTSHQTCRLVLPECRITSLSLSMVGWESIRREGGVLACAVRVGSCRP